MLITVNETTILNVDKVISLTVFPFHDSEKIKTSDGFLGLFPQYEWKLRKRYRLKFKYIPTVFEDKNHSSSTFDVLHEDFSVIETVAKHMIVQLKKFDSDFVDKAFEDIVLKDK